MGAHKVSALNNKACPTKPNGLDVGLYLNKNLGLDGDVGLELFSLDFDKDRCLNEDEIVEMPRLLGSFN